jgi:hypothetical protein
METVIKEMRALSIEILEEKIEGVKKSKKPSQQGT